MSLSIGANGASYNYPETDDTEWGDQATLYASAVSASLSAIGLGATLNTKAVIDLNSTTKGFLPPRMTTTQRNAIASPPAGLIVYNTTTTTTDFYDGSSWVPLKISDSPVWNESMVAPTALAVEGRFAKLSGANFTGNVSIQGDLSFPAASDVDLLDNNASALSFDTTGKTGILEIVTTDGAEKVKMSGGLDVTGAVDITGIITLRNDISTPNAIDIDLVDNNASALSFDAPGKAGILEIVTTDSAEAVKTSGQLLIADGTTTLPGIAFSSDTNTGIIRSATDQIDIVTGGQSRFRIESTGQIKAVYESQVGTDYNTTLHNGYLCRAWVNFSGTGTVAIRASGNVSSITDNGISDYTVNFTTPLPDANYCTNVNHSMNFGSNFAGASQLYGNASYSETAPTDSAFRFNCITTASSNFDPKYVLASVYR